MASNEIKILLGGDASGLVRASQDANNALAGIKTAADKVLPALSQIGPAADKANAAINALGARNSNTGLERLRGEFQKTAEALSGGINLNTGPINVQGPVNSLAQLRTAVTQLKIDLKAGIPISFAQSLQNIPRAADVAASAITKVNPAAKSAGFALQSVGRVVQDSAFGFVAIQNNITELPNAFRALSVAAKESGQSIGKVLLSSLTGAGGIGLALNIVTAALTFASVGFGAWTRVLGDSGKAQKEAKERADELAKAFKDIGSIVGDASSSVQGEIAQVQALASVVSNSNKPYADRARALTELKEINKNYFGDLKLEDGLTGKLAKTVSDYSAALVNSAISKKFADEISNVALAAFKADQDLAKSKETLTKQQKALNDANSNANLEVVGAQGVAKTRDQRKATNELKDAQLALIESEKTRNKLAEQQKKLRDGLNAAIVEGLKFKDLDTKGSQKEEDALKKRIDALKKLQADVGLTQPQQVELVQLEVKLAQRDGVKLGFTKKEVDDQVKAIIEKAFPSTGNEFVNVKREISVGGEIKFAKVKIDAPKIEPIDIAASIGLGEINIDEKGIAEKLRGKLGGLKTEIDKILEDFNAGVNESIRSGLADAFSGIGEGIGNALSGGFNLQNILEPLAGAIAGLLSNIGKLAIRTGIEIAGIKKALTLSIKNPAILIAGGIALVAIAAALKSQFNKQKVPGFADGTTNFGGGLALVGERGPELVNLPPGSDVIPNHALGGNINLMPSISFSGDQFRFMLNKVDARKRRV